MTDAEVCGAVLAGFGGEPVCVNPAGHKGAHAWHHDGSEHVTIVWWPNPPPSSKRRKNAPTGPGGAEPPARPVPPPGPDSLPFTDTP